MKRSLVTILLFAANVASADPKHVLVLRAEGSASADARGKVDTQVLKLAKSIPGNVEAGDISFTDAAAAVGCSPGDAPCRDEVLATMGVDELVVTTVAGSPSGELKISVRRITKGAPPKDASTLVPAGQPADAKMNTDIGPLFGLVQTPPPPAPPAAPPPSDKAQAAAALGASLGAKPGTETTAAPTPTPTPAPPPPPAPTPAQDKKVAQADTVTAAPNGQITNNPEGETDNHRLELIGVATGGGLVVVGALFWMGASSTQGDINNAPTRNPTDFKNLRDLESRGDTYATIGNIAVVGGLVLGGVSAFFYWRDRENHSTQQARLAPAVFPHGGGVTFTVGGGP